jgi:pyrroloquinoline quinone biosynthesis protein B
VIGLAREKERAGWGWGALRALLFLGGSIGLGIVPSLRTRSLASEARAETSASPQQNVHALVLGVTQDGGVPHIACSQELCVRARRDPSLRQRVACLGLVAGDRRFLVDATPDLASQLETLNAGRVPDKARPVDGILLTHAHIGHYTGLMYLGREALGARGVPVYATPRMAAFLRANGPWSQLVSLGNVELREIEPGKPFSLADGLRVTALPVPHRDEYSDTVAFRIEGPKRRLLYVPDIDKWEKWDRRLEDEVGEASVALLDGTFERSDELPGRSLLEIPHPLVSETAARLAGKAGVDARLIHLNHTNRLLVDEEAVRDLLARGLRVARDGEEIGL